MAGRVGIYSFPFRLYASEPLLALETEPPEGAFRVHVYAPITVRASGTPLSPDVPFTDWPQFKWNPGLPSERRLKPPKSMAKPAGSVFFDALRIDVHGEDTNDVLPTFLNHFLGWLRQTTRQPWIGDFEAQSDSAHKYGFRCDGEGRAIEEPFAYMKSQTFAKWTQLITNDLWANAAESAVQEEEPDPHWALFLDAQQQRATGRPAACLLSLALSMEVARDKNFPRFAETENKTGVGPVLKKPFDGTDLLAHLSSHLEDAHPDSRNLRDELPNDWEGVWQVYVARHHIAHGGPPVVPDSEGVRPADDEDLKRLSRLVCNVLTWIDDL